MPTYISLFLHCDQFVLQEEKINLIEVGPTGEEKLAPLIYLCLIIIIKKILTRFYFFQIVFDFSYDTNSTDEEREKHFYEGIASLRNMKNEQLNDDKSNLDLFKWVEQKIASTKNLESCISMLKV